MYAQIAPYYDALHGDVQADIQFLLTLVNEKPYRIIDLGCGSGRLTIPLAAAGHSVLGIDNSIEMLNRLEENQQSYFDEMTGGIKTVQADLTHFDAKTDPFDLAVIGYNTAMHFEQETLQAVLKNIHRHLTHSGELVIDLSNPFDLHQFEEASNLFQDEYQIEVDGRGVIVGSKMEIDQEKQAFNLSWRFEDDGDVISATERFFYYFPHQLQLMLEESRFKLDALYGDYLFNPFEEESDRLILLASKI